MKKILFGYISMLITIILAIALPALLTLNNFVAGICCIIAVFNIIISMLIIIHGHRQLKNF